MTILPKRKQQQKLKRVNVSNRLQWKKILKDIDKTEIPIELLESINVNLIDGSVVTIDIKELLDAGNEPEVLEQLLEVKLQALDNIIVNVDFLVSIKDVVKTVQPITNEILKKL
jgi:hypothetical protein